MTDSRSLDLHRRFQDIVASTPIQRDAGDVLGLSRAGRAVRGFRLGTGNRAVSLLSGCHADEPVGPRLLRHFVSYLAACDSADPILQNWEWWIVPHINPDGEMRNASWHDGSETAYDVVRYLEGVVRELPGDDIEFGFPRSETDVDARPENRAVYAWWQSCEKSFHVHCSLHGMAFAAGPWFLIDNAWRHRVDDLKTLCIARVETLGYTLHDVERLGEKGFVRLGRGFCTRPDSRFMIDHFEKAGDHETALVFRPSSMETIRAISGNVLTLVSEMPLFLTPGVGDELGPPDPAAVRWKERIAQWRVAVASGESSQVAAAAAASGLRAMNVRDQMDLQWTLIRAGIKSVAGGGP